MPSRRRAQAAVAQHAAELAEGQARLAREHDVGDRADAADHGLGGDLAPALGHDALHALAALEAGDLVAADDLDAVLLEHAAEEAPGGGAEAALERMVLEHDHRHARCRARSAKRRPRRRCRTRPRTRRARRPRSPRGCRRRCRGRAGSARPRAGRRRPPGGGPSRPVAISARSKPTSSLVESLAVRAAVSSSRTLVRVSSSTSLGSHQSAACTCAPSGPCSPRRYSLDAGGR